MERNTKISSNATIALLKSIHHANGCAFYIGSVIAEVQPKMNAKKFLTDLQRKATSILTDLKMKISDTETRATLETEISDPLEVDAIVDTYLFLTLENRKNFSEIAEFMLDNQIAAERRKENGFSAHFDERIGHSLEPLLQFRKENERHLKLINQQIEILESHKQENKNDPCTP